MFMLEIDKICNCLNRGADGSHRLDAVANLTNDFFGSKRFFEEKKDNYWPKQCYSKKYKDIIDCNKELKDRIDLPMNKLF